MPKEGRFCDFFICDSEIKGHCFEYFSLTANMGRSKRGVNAARCKAILDSDLSSRYIDTAGVCQGARGGLRWSLQQRGQMWRWSQERLQQFK